jgi:hypothetical protein
MFLAVENGKYGFVKFTEKLLVKNMRPGPFKVLFRGLRQLVHRCKQSLLPMPIVLAEHLPPPCGGILAYQQNFGNSSTFFQGSHIHFLVRMLPLVIAKHKETVLMVVGGGPDLQHLQDEAARIGIADHCVCTGYLDRRNLALVYAMADIFVFPSLTETQGLVTIEAMTSGTPVVAIGAMGTITVMNGDNGGFMVQDDLDAFATRVIDLLDDPALYAQKCAQAQEHAKAWTIDIMATRLERIYKDACAASLHDFQ